MIIKAERAAQHEAQKIAAAQKLLAEADKDVAEARALGDTIKDRKLAKQLFVEAMQDYAKAWRRAQSSLTHKSDCNFNDEKDDKNDDDNLDTNDQNH